MTRPDQHSRRDFLQGRAAARTLADKAQEWLDSTSSLLTQHLPSETVAHVHATRRAMACEFSIQYHQEDEAFAEAVFECLDLIERIEDKLTVYRETSEVIEINRQAATAPVIVDAQLFALLQLAKRLYEETAAALDITSGPLSRVWGFFQRKGRLPSDEEIAAALENVGSKHLILNETDRSVEFAKRGLEINFNSLGKGYALDRAAALLREQGLEDFLLQGGGSSILARGDNRAEPTGGWTIGLRNPLKPECRLLEFHLRDRALATAGGATQAFEHGGRTFSHILDPRTGWPAEGVLSATILASNATLADALATACFVMGRQQAEEYCQQHPEVGLVLVCPAKRQDEVEVLSCGMQKSEWTRH